MSLAHLRELYADPPTSRPRPGDIVRITNLDGEFKVISFDRAIFTLRSEYGVTLRAGVLVVRLALEAV